MGPIQIMELLQPCDLLELRFLRLQLEGLDQDLADPRQNLLLGHRRRHGLPGPVLADERGEASYAGEEIYGRGVGFGGREGDSGRGRGAARPDRDDYGRVQRV